MNKIKPIPNPTSPFSAKMSVKFDFQNRDVWIVGAQRGIGRAIADAFVEAGANVTGFDLKFAGDEKFITRELDVTDAAEVHAIAQNVSKIDVLVNAAGTLTNSATENLEEKDWNRVFNVNVKGSFNLFKNLIPQFKKQRFGSIVVLASNSAHVPRIGMSAYGASKSALVRLTQSVGLELAEYGVRTNVVSPGSTNTDMLGSMLGNDFAAGEKKLVAGLPDQYKLGIPLKKIAQPGEIAATVLFLASDASSHTILQDIVIDGGATLAA